MRMKLVIHTEEEMAEGFGEQGAEEDIWAQGRRGNRELRKLHN
jgi:hypothetical protein